MAGIEHPKRRSQAQRQAGHSDEAPGGKMPVTGDASTSVDESPTVQAGAPPTGNSQSPSVPNPSSASSRIIWNPFLGLHLAQSPGRMRRRELSDECAFCADLTAGRVPPGAQTWIRPNDFPPLRPPDGECFILIYHPDHNRSFADLTADEVARVVALWQEIYDRLEPRYPAVMTWETSGAEIGQTQYHPHGQTFGLSVVPDTLAREMAVVARALAASEGCPFCAEVMRESGGPRVVVEGEHWLAHIPEYARFPYQTHFLPRCHTHSVAGLDRGGAQSRELARMLLSVVRAYNRLYEAPMPYMLALHQLADARFHFHIELLPVGRSPGKLKYAASSESAWGFWVNDSLPVDKAAEVRSAIASLAENILPVSGVAPSVRATAGVRRGSKGAPKGGKREQEPGAR